MKSSQICLEKLNPSNAKLQLMPLLIEHRHTEFWQQMLRQDSQIKSKHDS
jgi:hypothetical protein